MQRYLLFKTNFNESHTCQLDNDLPVLESQTVKTKWKEITFNFYLMEQLIIKLRIRKNTC